MGLWGFQEGQRASYSRASVVRPVPWVWDAPNAAGHREEADDLR